MTFARMCRRTVSFLDRAAGVVRRRKIGDFAFSFQDLGHFWSYNRNGTPAQFVDFVMVRVNFRKQLDGNE